MPRTWLNRVSLSTMRNKQIQEAGLHSQMAHGEGARPSALFQPAVPSQNTYYAPQMPSYQPQLYGYGYDSQPFQMQQGADSGLCQFCYKAATHVLPETNQGICTDCHNTITARRTEIGSPEIHPEVEQQGWQ